MQSMEIIKPRLWTESGLKELGQLIKQARIAKGLSLRALQDYIKERTGYDIAYTTLGRVERGSGEPNYNTVVVIAASGFVLKENGEPYTMEELGAIASQTYSKNGHSLIIGGVSPRTNNLLLLNEADIDEIADRIAKKMQLSEGQAMMRNQSCVSTYSSMSLRNFLLSKLASAGFDVNSAAGLQVASQRLAQASQMEEPADCEMVAAVLRGERDRLDNYLLLMLVEGFALLLNGDQVTFEQLLAAQRNNGTHTPNGHGCGVS